MIKRALIAVSLLLAVVGLCGPSYGEDGVPIFGFTTGNIYLESTDAEKKAWVAGVVDGVLAETWVSSIRNPEINGGAWFGGCVDRKSLRLPQIKAIFEKYLKSQPEKWNEPAALLFEGKFLIYCGAKKTKP